MCFSFGQLAWYLIAMQSCLLHLLPDEVQPLGPHLQPQEEAGPDESTITANLDFGEKQFRKMYLEKGGESEEVKAFMTFKPHFKALKNEWDRIARKRRVSSKNLAPHELAKVVTEKLNALNSNVFIYNNDEKHTKSHTFYIVT